jgi:hypothetical protein
MLKPIRFVTLGFVLVAIAGPVLAGWPLLIIGNPEASAAARSVHAVLTAKPGGCLAPDNTTVTAAVVGVVSGERRSIPLKLTRLSEDGLYAVTPQWPPGGKWVLQLTATDGMRTASALVPAGPNGVERRNARFFPRQTSPGDIDSVLNGQPAAVAKK